MNNSEAYFNQLRFSSDIGELYRGIDRLIALGNFEAVTAIRRYFLHSPIKVTKIYIIKKIPELTDLKSKFRLLIEFSYTNDNELKVDILKSISKIKHPIFSHRLFSIYSHTQDEYKKIEILKIFISTGISLFKENLLSQFSQETIKVKRYILTYLVNTPFLSEESCQQMISLISDLLSHEQSEIESEIETEKLLYNLWLMSVNNPKITKEAKKTLQKSKHDYSLLYHLYEVVQVNETKLLSNAKVIEALYQNNNQIIHQVRFSDTFIKGFITSLEKKLLEIEKDFHSHNDSQFIWNLLRLNHKEIVILLIDVFNHSNHFNFKQTLLDVLSFFYLSDDSKEQLKSLCLNLFKDQDHIRIFESLTRNTIILFSHEGLKIVYNHYEHLNNIEQKVQILSGIIHALMDFGLGKGLKALDKYTLNMILGNSIDQAMSFSKQDSKQSNSHYVSKIFQIINLLQIDTYIDEMIVLAQNYGITLEVLASLLSLNNEKATDFIKNNFEKWVQNPAEHKNKIQLTLYELSRRRVKGMEFLSRETMLFLLEQPPFTAEVISYCQRYARQDLIPATLKFRNINTLHLQYSLIDMIGQYPKLVEDDIIENIYQKGDSFIKQKIAPLIMPSSKIKLLEKVYEFFMNETKDLKGLIAILEYIPLIKSNIKKHLQIIKHFEQKIAPEHLRKIKSTLVEHLYFYAYHKDEPTPEEEKQSDNNDKEKFKEKRQKPIDKVSTREMKQALYTAEHLQRFFTDQINHEANLDTLDIDSVTTEYKKFIFLGYKNYLIEKIPSLFKNTSFVEIIFKVFPKAIHYQEFIKKSAHFNQVQLQLKQLTDWIEVITKEPHNLEEKIESLDDLVHLYAMLLHKNDFYSINNPLEVNLDYFYEHNIINLLNDLGHLAFIGGDGKETDKQAALEYIKNLREKTRTLAGFLVALDK